MLQSIQELIPSYAKDIKLNFSSIMHGENKLSQQQFWGVLVSSAMASKNKNLLLSIMEDAQKNISPEAINAAKSASALMAMNNIYYRFTHLVSNNDYVKLPANLRMNVMANPGISKTDFELYSLAVSAIHGCGKCMDAHEKTLTLHGMDKESIQTTIRIASIIHATATVLDMET